MLPTERDTPYSLLLRLSQEIRDEHAWNEFVQRYQPHIRSWCCERGLQSADAEDVSQIVLEQLLRTMREFRYDPRRSFRAWLRTVTVRACNRFVIKEHRAAGRKDLPSLRRLDEAPARQELARRLEEAFDEELLELAMESVRESVAPHTWEAFRLTALLHHSGAEAARQLTMPIMHVYVARQRVQMRLRQEVKRLQRMMDQRHEF
ncbi:MAG TPA: sigma-70 family RNA polymerase sigma factor [Gemmataceae bacterium]|jgi:RNA polymerase sigma-70 factor (ECF subfamily)